MRAWLAVSVLLAALGPPPVVVAGEAAEEEDLPDLGIDWSELSPEAASRIKADLRKKRNDASKAAEERRAKRQQELEKREKQDFSKVAKCDFSTAGCWEEFYKMHTGHFDWYQVPVSVLEPHVAALPGELGVLHVGCGTSTWTKEIGDMPRVTSVLNTDINGPAVERMRDLYASDPRLRFEVMDAANMTLPDASFDVVLDKGLLDIFRPRGDEVFLGTAREMRRVLRQGGLLAFVSYSPREKQPPEILNWCSHEEVKEANLYVCIKGEKEEGEMGTAVAAARTPAREEL